MVLREVLYCQVCSMPPEYCEFHPSAARCAQWLLETHPSVHSVLYPHDQTAAPTSAAAATATTTTASSSRGGKAQLKDDAKRQERLQADRLSARIRLKRDARNKRKSTTTIIGMGAFGIDLKKAAKRLAGRFACGCSVQEGAPGMEQEGDVVVLQGDFVGDLMDVLPAEFPDLISPRQISVIE